MHETLRVAYEKGQPVPPELIEKLTRSSTRQSSMDSGSDADLRRAVVLIAVGLGLAALGVGLWVRHFDRGSAEGGAITGGIVAGSGAIPGFHRPCLPRALAHPAQLSASLTPIQGG